MINLIKTVKIACAFEQFTICNSWMGIQIKLYMWQHFNGRHSLVHHWHTQFGKIYQIYWHDIKRNSITSHNIVVSSKPDTEILPLVTIDFYFIVCLTHFQCFSTLQCSSVSLLIHSCGICLLPFIIPFLHPGSHLWTYFY